MTLIFRAALFAAPLPRAAARAALHLSGPAPLSALLAAPTRLPSAAPTASNFHAKASPLTMAAVAEGAGLVAKHNKEDCIFCKIVSGVIPSYKVLETDHAVAILDAFPMTKGHTLLLPKKHYAFLEDMPADEAGAVLKELPRLARAVRIATGVEGINIAQNNGSIAGQVVFHVHIHILPRTEADGLVKLGKSGGKIEDSVATDVQGAIAAAL